MRVAMLLLTSCASGGMKGGEPDTAMNSDERLGTSEWEIISDEIPGGVLLSAFSDGDALRFVGGELGGGSGMMVHWDNGVLCWEPKVSDRALWWIHGDDDDRWVAVGEAGTVLLSERGTRSRIDVPTDATLYGVWIDGDEIWAAGGMIGSGENRGEIWHWNGGGWTDIALDLPGVIFKVWDGWFVGQDVTYRWDGDAVESIHTSGRLLTVRGRSAEDIWAVGGLTGPLVVQWDGSTWAAQETTGLDQALNGIWTAPGEDIWVAGNYGTTAYWDGSEWMRPDQPLTTDHLHAVWRHNDETWWMGGDLFQVGDNHGVLIRHGGSQAVPEAQECAD